MSSTKILQCEKSFWVCGAVITSSEIVTMLNPEGSATKFQSAPVASAVSRSILTATAVVQAHLPEQYRRIIRTIPGLVLTRDAVEGDTQYTIPDWIEFQSGRLWRNLDGVWYDRKNADVEEFTYDEITHTVTTSEEAEEGDTVVMEIVHSSEYPEVLKTLCLKIAVSELIGQLPRLVASEDREWYTNDLENAYVFLNLLRKGDFRIDIWDELDLIKENETITPMGPGTLDPNGW